MPVKERLGEELEVKHLAEGVDDLDRAYSQGAQGEWGQRQFAGTVSRA